MGKQGIDMGFELLRTYCTGRGLDFGPLQEERFEEYFRMLVEKNKVMNLTAITERDEVEEKHFLDSIALAEAADLSGSLRLADIGTGAGFPGLPLKILFPKLHVVLIDSLQKRVDFLKEVIERLDLSGVEALHFRAEDAARQPDLRESFDLCVSRAVAELPVLAEYCLPFVKQGGLFISYKSRKAEEEARTAQQAFSLLGGGPFEIRSFSLGPSGIPRSFVLVEKTGKTPEKYPRAAGKVRKKPL